MTGNQPRDAAYLLCFVVFTVLAFGFFFANGSGPVGEFGSYVRVTHWDSVYGPFFRPLSINLMPSWLQRNLGADYTRYAFVFGVIFATGLTAAAFLLRASVRWAASEERSLPLLAALTAFGFSNVYVVSTLMVQYTATDFVFMTAYALFLLSVIAILNTGRIGVGGGVAVVAGLALMCASKEFTLVAPVMLVVLLALRPRETVALATGQQGRSLVLVLLLAAVAGIYLALLLSKPTYVADALAGVPPPGEDFARAGAEKFRSNLTTSLIWLTQAPLEVNYPYVFNPLPILGRTSRMISWGYGALLLLGAVAAFLRPAQWRVVLFHLVGVAFWGVLASSNSRVLSSYLAAAFLHAAMLWGLGALTVLQLARSAWAARMVGAGCVALLLWSMWLGSAVLYSPNREVSFHGAMAAADGQYRSTLRMLAMSHERFSAAFDLRNAPEHVVFHLRLAGDLGARSELALESFSVDDAAQTILVAGRKRNTPASGDRAEVHVLIEPDPHLGSRFRIMDGAPSR